MTIGPALALATMVAAAIADRPPPIERPAASAPTAAAPNSVLSEMAPSPGNWEAEDAPAYFGLRPGIADAPAPGEPSAEAALGDIPVAHRRP